MMYSSENLHPYLDATVHFVINECVRYYATFQSLSHVAKFQFEARLWSAQRHTNVGRLGLIQEYLSACKKEISLLNSEDINDNWSKIKRLAAEGMQNLPQPVCQSFLASLEDALFPRVDVGERVQQFDIATSKISKELVYLEDYGSFDELSTAILEVVGFSVEFEDLDLDVTSLSLALENQLTLSRTRVTLFPNLFYRNQHAYLVGVIETDHRPIPLTIAFVNDEGGIKADAFFFTEAQIIRIFEFTRSYFLVETTDPEGLIAFLLRVMPHKRAEQLIVNLGFQEWGKHLIKRNFDQYLRGSQNQLVHAPGIEGMVMLVFTLPDYPMVFKAIKKDIAPPKVVTPQKVLDKYHLVSRHDRVGRMADAQLFKLWSFPKKAFAPPLLADLEKLDGQHVEITEDRVTFTQLFTERKMIPLNLYLNQVSTKEAEAVVIDYGNAIKEMAMSNIFPGDLLLKNFGVTADKRVVFYDYDEVVFLTDCTFRELPKARNDEELWDNESWLVVGENDIFPEELEKFMLPAGPYRALFRKHHGDIFEIHFWNQWKAFHQEEGFIDLQPY